MRRQAVPAAQQAQLLSPPHTFLPPQAWYWGTVGALGPQAPAASGRAAVSAKGREAAGEPAAPPAAAADTAGPSRNGMRLVRPASQLRRPGAAAQAPLTGGSDGDGRPARPLLVVLLGAGGALGAAGGLVGPGRGRVGLVAGGAAALLVGGQHGAARAGHVAAPQRPALAVQDLRVGSGAAARCSAGRPAGACRGRGRLQLQLCPHARAWRQRLLMAALLRSAPAARSPAPGRC
jgi:hypothetical protein